MALDDQQATDELMLRDLPGKLALLVFALATLALGWEIWGVLFQFGSFPQPLAALDLGEIAGIAMFTIGWLGVLVGLLVLHRGRHHSTN